MAEYNILRELSVAKADELARRVKVVPYGKHTDLLRPIGLDIIDMDWDGLYALANVDEVKFSYDRRKWPNSRWPWPFRNVTRPTVVVEGLSMYGAEKRLLFQFQVNEGSAYLRPGDQLVFGRGNLRIAL